MGAILHPGGPATSAVRSSQWVTSQDSFGVLNSPSSPTFPTSPVFSRIGEGRGLVNEVDFVLVVSSDEPLLRRMNEIEGADAECVTVSTSRRGSDARWRLDLEEGDTVAPTEDHADSDEVGEDGKAGNVVVKVLKELAAVRSITVEL